MFHGHNLLNCLWRYTKELSIVTRLPPNAFRPKRRIMHYAVTIKFASKLWYRAGRLFCKKYMTCLTLTHWWPYSVLSFCLWLLDVLLVNKHYLLLFILVRKYSYNSMTITYLTFKLRVYLDNFISNACYVNMRIIFARYIKYHSTQCYE